MTVSMLVVSMGFFIGLNALLWFNDRFRTTFMKTLWERKMFVIVPVFFWFALNLLLGNGAAAKAAPMLITLVFTLVQVILFIGFQFYLMFRMMGRPDVEWYFPGEADELTWDEWIGAPEVKQEAMKMVESLRNWNKYAEHGTKPANGAILFGAPGTGKSLLAKVIASQAGMPVCIAAAGSLNGPFVAMGMMIVKQLCRKIRRIAARHGGVVVFLDEIDAIAASRQGMTGGGTRATQTESHRISTLIARMFMGGGGGMGGNGTLQTLLTEMSGAASGETKSLKLRKRWGLAKRGTKRNWRILWIAATNIDLSMLDAALMRSGRFGSIKLPINPPTDNNRLELFKLYLRKKTISGDIDYPQLVQLSRGMTGADIEEVCEAASRTVIYEGTGDGVTFDELWRQIRFKRWGAPSPVPLHPEERWSVAVHEAGHGVAIVDLPPTGILCAGATLRPTDEFLGAVMAEQEDDSRRMLMEEDAYRYVLWAVGSRASEEIILQDRSAGVGSDLQQAMHRALGMVESWGFGRRLTTRLSSDGHSQRAIKEAEDIVNATFVVAKRLVTERREAVEALAHALMEQVDMTGPQVIDLVKSTGTACTITSVKDEVEKILAEMREQERREQRESRVGPSEPEGLLL